MRTDPRGASVAVLLCAVLGGCYPGAAGFYRPSADGAQAIADRCVGMESQIELRVGGVPVRARVEEVRGSTFVGLVLRPDAGPEVRFASAAFELRDAATGEGIAVRSMQREADRLRVDDPLPAGPATGEARFLWVRLEAADLHRHQAFLLRSPPLIVGGIAHGLPEIRFERRTWAGAVPFNC